MIRLPLREFDLLANLARVPDRPLSRDALLRAVWRIDFDPGTNRVEVQMSRRSEEHTSELQSLMRISYAVFCLKKKKKHTENSYYSRTREKCQIHVNYIKLHNTK